MIKSYLLVLILTLTLIGCKEDKIKNPNTTNKINMVIAVTNCLTVTHDLEMDAVSQQFNGTSSGDFTDSIELQSSNSTGRLISIFYPIDTTAQASMSVNIFVNSELRTEQTFITNKLDTFNLTF